jgi:hypothetical protein
MSANDDDHGGDDDQLKQLRSVWVSMRESDEDPPDRGLDALMAAARTKAAEMTPAPGEGFWAKALAVFRRPPVLALASITVLLGGALFVMQRRDTLQARDTAGQRQVETAPGAGSAAPAPATLDLAPPPAATTGAPAATPPPEIAVPGPVEATRERPRPRPGNRSNGAGTPAVAEQPRKPANKQADEGGEDARSSQPTVTETIAIGGLEQASPEAVTVAPQGTTRAPVAKQPPGDSFGRSEAKLAIDEDTASATTDGRAKDSQVTQLVKQCESAAARKDCAAVRVLAKKIKSADAEAYKQRVANNTAIARCLE